ncbi:uncharacterized protein FFB20_14679 [Fusarium fujikuroi]|uniref:Uncharacterized protein n=1 Tax=Gibberella fujikuroi (strain CBS 195.34 / IMI 58289 / NRRL A-6831) TaxID=1279085 RepID=S0DUI6_GIBF5|nr:uncharacterized protein FFUJ_03087 [Fusarium fujikuroi IMI 58289]KLO89947.1 uncharacterized protein LW93_2011 [Fusarium fujikuroi]KLP01563.1 uncharacterized protein Y057_6061 [Fusarium fujikuroi]KLP17033.1 uncharacterized protein LW94_4113 [Fusarium fujikuroi]CCT66090.1 uncharacterized protein FFUJ_03087 [Fusarium fujikuroi IMI 58289]SCN77789.1 uncharacterized protein FFE2_03928 [Fusarium fujikuroi]
MNINRVVRIFPCILCWTPEVKCPNYVFLKKSICVDCERMGRQFGDNEVKASDLHIEFAQYLLDKYREMDGITYERVNKYIEKAKKRYNVDNLLTAALDYIFRNFSEVYHAVCDALEAARDRGPMDWTHNNLTERLERLREEKLGKNWEPRMK